MAKKSFHLDSTSFILDAWATSYVLDGCKSYDISVAYENNTVVNVCHN